MQKRRVFFIGVTFVITGLVLFLGIQVTAESIFDEKVFSVKVDGIPTIYVKPDKEYDKKRLVIWLDGFTGNKERTTENLKELARHGFTAVSFDKWEHGERGRETPNEMYNRIQKGFQRNFWPILGHSSLDAIKIIDWAIKEFDLSDKVCMGGFSMGGDIAVSVAGYDKRVNCVAAVVTSPDWLRPGRKDVSVPAKTQSELKAQSDAEHFYKTLDPMTHLQAYSAKPAITFELGEDDTLIQSVWALNFQKKLKDIYGESNKRLRVVLHKHTGHQLSNEMWMNCLEWFDTH